MQRTGATGPITTCTSATPTETLSRSATTDSRRSNCDPLSDRLPFSVLEWRVDPTSERPDPALAGSDGRLILIGEHGYSSSLAVIRLHELGFSEATDVIGGAEA